MVQLIFLSTMPQMPDMVRARLAKESLTGSATTVTPAPSRSGPVSLPSEHEVCAPTSRTQSMTGDFRRRKYYVPEEPASLIVNAASPTRDSTSDQLREERDQIMQVKIEGQMQKRSFGCWWTTYWAVLDQSAIRFYNSEQASISQPDALVEELAASCLVPEIPKNQPTWIVCTDGRSKRKVLYLRSGCGEPTWEDVASARLWHWALGGRLRGINRNARSSTQ